MGPADSDFTSLASLALAALEVDGVFVGRVLSRALHILGAMILGGGLFYLKVVLAPAGVDACFADRRAVWARWVGMASGLLILSGVINLMAIMAGARQAGEKLPPTYHMLFGIKVLLALAVMFIASILAGRTEAADRFRASMRRWLSVAWAAVIAIVVLGAVLRMMHGRTPADDANNSSPATEAVDGQES